MLYRYEWKSPVGELILGSYRNQLCLCDWKYRSMRETIDLRIQRHYQEEFHDGSSEVIQSTMAQLTEYFEKRRKVFDVNIDFVGTPFQQKVWRALIEIPYGKTMSYLALSQLLGDEKAIRAVASANGANGISILIPCHRIIGANGSLVGYAGGIDVKKKLLVLESGIIQESLF